MTADAVAMTTTTTRWDQSPLLFALYLALILAVLVMVARKRGAGFDTYWRMPLHVLSILFISMVVKHSLHWVFDVPAGNDNLNRTSWWYLIV
ncbi:MAG: hypothetical protein LW854_21585, partial [Rubrivivax sp.]|nr:hypothetical protein [Rubrivivax sp.]